MKKKTLHYALFCFVIYALVSLAQAIFPAKPVLQREVTGYITTDKNLQDRQLSDLAFTLFAEDRTNKQGMKYVLSVIINRAKSTEISAMHAVALRRKQFSCWVDGKRIKQTYNARDRERYAQALEIVRHASERGFKPLTTATHYYNPKKVTPYWRHQYAQVAAVNSHVFLVRSKPARKS